jgi:glucose/arabinose dehydrogenase
MRCVFALVLAASGGCHHSGAPHSVPANADPPVLRHHEIRVSDLPAPRITDVENPPQVIARPQGANLVLPPGFSSEIIASEFKRPRGIAVSSGAEGDGAVWIVDSEAGTITVMRGSVRDVFARNIELPFGIAIAKGFVFVGATDAVLRYPIGGGPPEKITDLPGGGYRQHWTRNVAVSPDQTKLYVTVGSRTNVDVEEPPRASILEMNLDGSGRRQLATGTRNPVGLAFHPTTHKLFAAVQERDLLGDDLVPDYVTEVKDGGFYGWPYGWAGGNEDPRRKGERPDLVKQILTPDVMVQAHAAVLGLAFYTGSMFPSEYAGDAFVAFHGSWNRSKRTGYSIARIRFKDGRPIGGYDDFCTGWMLGEDVKEVWGRPVGIAVAKDGSLLVTDDGAGAIWRITFSSGR